MIGGSLVLRSPKITNPMRWEFFAQEFKDKYVSDMYQETKCKQFLNLKQRNLSMAEYEKEFRKDRKDGVFCSSSFNLLHDSNSSICNE